MAQYAEDILNKIAKTFNKTFAGWESMHQRRFYWKRRFWKLYKNGNLEGAFQGGPEWQKEGGSVSKKYKIDTTIIMTL